MNRPSILRKSLSLIIIVLLLSLRLGSFAGNTFTTPVADALFQKAFIAEHLPLGAKLIKAKLNIVFEVLVDENDLEDIIIENAGQITPPFVSDLILKDILSQMFIPPEVLS